MKRILITLSFIAFAIANVFAVENYDFSAVCESGQTLYYKITNNSEPYTVAVTYAKYYEYNDGWSQRRYYYYYNHPQPAGDIIIPESVVYNGVEYSVTRIDTYAFYGCEFIESVDIPNTVTSIGSQAFKDYRNLKYVIIPKTVTAISGNTFSRMDGYNTFPIYYCEPSSNPGWDDNWNNNIGTIFWNTFVKDDYVFQIQDNNVTILKYRGDNQTLTIPSTVTYDGSEYTVTSIYSYAFQNCNLTSVTIPNSVTSIYDNAFYGCDNIETLTYNTNAIGAHFSGKTSLKTVNIGSSVTNISNYAFSGCSSLTTLLIPNSVTDIGCNAFEGCSGLISISLPEGITKIESSTFQNCSSLTSVTIPNSVTTIGQNTFYNCGSLSALTIPNTVTSIGAAAFFGCSGLASISIPEGITKIESSTFQNCSSLTSITIPNSINSIGSSAFAGCSGLTSIPLSSNITVIESDTYMGCAGLTSVILPNTVTSVGGQAFKNCINLTSFTFPESVSLGNSILAGCNNLEYIEIPCSHCNRDLGKKLFGSPRYEDNASYVPISLKDVVIKGNCTSIEDYTFCGWKGVSSITIPGSITGFGVNNFSTFSGCPIQKVDYGNIENLIHSGLGSILTGGSWSLYSNGEEIVDLVIPDGVTSIDYKAFFKCVNLKSVTIPNSVTSIESRAFGECNGLELVTIPVSVITIGENAFNNSNITFICEAQSKPNGWRTGWSSGYTAAWNSDEGTVYWGVSFIEDDFAYKIIGDNTVMLVKYIGRSETIEIPSSVEHNGTEYVVVSIGPNAFQNYSSLKSITIPTSVEIIGNGAFQNCSKLQSIIIPQSVTAIGDDAFSGTGLTSLSIPNKVATIGANAFQNCGHLKTVNISASVESMGANVFIGCDSIETLFFNTNAIGSQFSGKQRITTINIGNGVTTVPANAFSGCSGLSQVVISNNVLAIADNAFNGCTSLESVSVPNTVETIGNSAFNGCSSLSSVSLPSSITTINEYAFAGCSNLQSISIPRSVTGIGRYAFSGAGLTSLSVPNQVATIGTYAFQNCNHLKTVSIPSSVESIGANAFSGCDSITTLSFNTNAIDLLFAGKRVLSTINIGEEVTAIPNSAFASTNLTTIALPDNVTTIGSYAFDNCKHLKTVSIPSSVESIGGGAFSGCDSIKSLTFNTNAIGDLFSGKKELMVVNIGEAVTSLNANAFKGCTSLPIIIIPDGVENVGASAFANCSSLTIYITKAKVPTDWNAQWNPDPRPVVVSAKVSGDFIYQVTNISSRELSIVRYLGNSPAVSIPEAPVISGNTFSVKAVGNSAFAGIDALRQIVVPNSVTSIGDYAFSDCANLETVIMGNSLASIGDNAFNECRKVSSIKIGNATPPTVGESAFEAIDKWETAIYVPCNSLQTYRAAASWNEFVQYIGSQSFILEVDSENERKGIAKITQQPDCANSTAVIEATAKAGYTFLSWSDGNTANPRTLTVSGNLALTALFAVDVNVAITSSDTERGHVENITPIYEYDYNAPITVQAVAHHGYSFAGWDDGSNENPRTITLNQEVAIQALFSINQYHLALSVNNAARGSIVDNSGDYDFKTQITTSATANYGYKFVGWNDGVSASQRTILLWNDTTIQAVFEHEKYMVTLNGNVEGRGTFTGGGEHNYLTECQITATPLYGYEFTGWSDGVSDNPRNITVTKPIEYTAVFVPKVYELSVTSANEDLGTVAGSNSFDYKTVTNISATAATHYHFVQWNDGNRQNPRQVTVERDTQFVATFGIDTFNIVAAYNTTMGAVSGAGQYSYGTAAIVEATPAAHHHFVRWTNGVVHTTQEFVVEYDTAFEAVFAIDRHSVALAASDSLCGAVSGAGEYDYGAGVQLQATPAANCYFAGWSDGVTTNPRTLTVEGDTNIVAEFEPLPQFSIKVEAAHAERGTTSGTGEYVQGSQVTLSATAAEHYVFSQWSDGRTDNPRTVRVIADATYTAVFEPMEYYVKLAQNNANMGMVSGDGVYSYGTVVSCLATPYPNYHFVQWSNGERTNPYEFVVSEDVPLLTAYFAEGAATAIGDESVIEPTIYVVGKTIVVENATDEICVYDAMGKLICRDAIHRVRAELRVNAAGVYIVKTGNVVMRVVVE